MDLDLPDQGLILIKARSGGGKTTIFDAIKDAFFSSEDNVTTWGEKASAINLNFLGMDITKRRGPHSLILEVNGQTFNDDVAQGGISERLGMSYEEFMASSYVQQEGAGSLLTLTPAEQLRFIQKLAFGVNDPESFKEKIAGLVTQKEHAVKLADVLAANASEAVLRMRHKLDRAKEALPAKPEDPELLSADDLAQALVLNHGARVNNKTEISMLEEELASPAYKFLDFFSHSKKQHEENIASFQADIVKLHETLVGNGKAFEQMSKELCVETMELITEYDKYDKWKTEAENLKNEAIESFGMPADIGVSDFLTKEMVDLDSKTSNLTSKILLLSNELNELSTIHTCESCGAGLVFIEQKLKLKSKDLDVSTKKQELETKRDSLVEERKLIIEKKHSMGILFNKVYSLKNNKISRPNKERPSLSMPELKLFLQENTKKEQANKDIEQKISTLSEQLQKNKESLNSLEQSYLKNISAVRPKDEVVALLRTAKEEHDKLHQEMVTLNENKAKREKYLKDLKDHEYGQKIIASAELDLLSANDQANLANSQLVEAKKSLAATLKLKQISDKASLEAIEDIIGSINVNAKYYLDQMFDTDGMVAGLTNKKTLASGEERAKIGINIFYKGTDVKKIKDLSGGEKSRLTLAFQLAMSDMYNSPLLLLDEAFAGLDTDNTLPRCLEVLRMVASKKPVFVIEHGAPESFFDHIIDL